MSLHDFKQSHKKFEILKENSMHPSLHLKKVGNYWSVRVGKKHPDYIGNNYLKNQITTGNGTTSIKGVGEKVKLG